MVIDDADVELAPRGHVVVLVASARDAGFEEGVLVGVEQVAAVGGKPKPVVFHSGVDSSGQCEQALPGAGAALHRGTVAVGVGFEPIEQGRNGVLVGIELILGDGQQATFLGDEEEDGAHEHTGRRGVHLVAGDAAEEFAPGSAVGPGDRVDQDLGGPTDLLAEGVGQFLLSVLRQLDQLRGRRVAVKHTLLVQERNERILHDSFFQPVDAPCSRARGAGDHVDEQVLLSVGGQRQFGPGTTGQERGPLHRGGDPPVMVAAARRFERLRDLGDVRPAHDHHADVVGVV